MTLMGELDYVEVEFVSEWMGNPVGSKMNMLRGMAEMLDKNNPSPIKILEINKDVEVKEKEVKSEEIENKMVEKVPMNKMVSKATKTKSVGIGKKISANKIKE